MPQVSRITGIPSQHITYLVRRGRFDDPAVQGRPINQAIGYRDSRTWRASLNPVVFIDPRILGGRYVADSYLLRQLILPRYLP